MWGYENNYYIVNYFFLEPLRYSGDSIQMYILYCFQYYYLALHMRNMCKVYWFFKENEDIILNTLSRFLLIHIKKLAETGIIIQF